MDRADVFEITWTQLPQRSSWLKIPTAPSDQKGAPLSGSSRKIGTPYSATVPAGKQPGGWEYLDHTADVQIHAWGTSINEAFGAAVVGMSGYMVELDEIKNDLEVKISVDGHDFESLLYNLMSECLYCFHTEHFVAKEIFFDQFDAIGWKLSAIARGGAFDASKHSQGTEVKAITYSNLQVTDNPGRAEIYVIVDI